MSEIREKLIAAGVRNLKEFGYPGVNAGNILTDRIFSAFFLSMLEENKGRAYSVDKEIDALISEIKAKTEPKTEPKKKPRKKKQSL